MTTSVLAEKEPQNSDCGESPLRALETTHVSFLSMVLHVIMFGCVCTWRPKVNFRCLPQSLHPCHTRTHAHVRALAFLRFFEIESLSELKFTRWFRQLASKPLQSSFVCCPDLGSQPCARHVQFTFLIGIFPTIFDNFIHVCNKM